MTALRSPFAEPFRELHATDLAATLKVVADPHRLRILAILHKVSPMTVKGVTTRLGDISQPTTSHHLKVLTLAGLITRRQEGVFVYYQLAYGAVQQLAGLIDPGAGLKRGGS